MINKSLFSLFLLFSTISFAQLDSSYVEIEGFAPDYLGREITICGIQDYLSEREEVLARCTVNPKDSLFHITFKVDGTKKILVRGESNMAHMYVQQGGEYQVFLPEKDPYLPSVKSGNVVELTFYNVPETDINYKVLSFQRWTDDYMSRFYKLKKAQPEVFANKLDTFKMYVERAYKSETDIYFMTFVRFSIAQLDEIEFAGSRNRYEKYDFYIDPSPIFYENDAYMHYLKNYYRNFVPRLSNKGNIAYYNAVIKSSPTLLMKALGTEYSLKNLRIREIVMIQSLSEVFYSDDFPQTNIMTILDSLSKRAMFVENRTIAENIIFRLTDLVPGAAAPKFVIRVGDSIKTHYAFLGKHLYLHFFDPSSQTDLTELELVHKLNETYGNSIQIVSLIINSKNLDLSKIPELDQMNWEKHMLKKNDPLLDKFKIRSFPSYVLIDGAGIIIGAPALAPTPNSKYETIEKTFFYIHKLRKEAGE
jgi:hypothetical protein